MVDALRLARDWIAPEGCVIDLHPTAYVATVHVGEQLAGRVSPGGATTRHQNATDAIATAARLNVFTIADTLEFDFFTHADTVDELNEHVLTNWRETRLGEATIERARVLLKHSPSSRICVRERVAGCRMVP